MVESEAAVIVTKSISRGVEEDKSNQWGPPVSVTRGRRGEQRAVRRCRAETGKRERHRNGQRGKAEQGSSGLWRKNEGSC